MFLREFDNPFTVQVTQTTVVVRAVPERVGDRKLDEARPAGS
jgi:hypothetical protein